VLRVCREHKAL
jgi:hypothetical protein